MPVHQATCVALGDRAILIEGVPGSGKSSLGLALIDRGAVLVGDDGVLLAQDRGQTIARPHPQTLGLLEVRNLGLLRVPTCAAAAVALVVRLDVGAPRYPDQAESCAPCGSVLPLIRLTPHDPLLPIKVELALQRLGHSQPFDEGASYAAQKRAGIMLMPSESPLPPTASVPLIAPDAQQAVGGSQRLLLVTGLLGAGKTTALRELEDRGWEAIDNFPVRLFDRLLEPSSERNVEPRPALAIGFDSRTRGFSPHDIIALLDRLRARGDLAASSLFLDCSDAVLERRYNETRRRHPLAGDQPASSGIAFERELLAPLRACADMVLDTSELTTNALQQVIRERFAPDGGQEMTVTVSSFGFSRAMPPLADLVFDMRFLDNPHWDPALRPLTGRDAPVGEHIRSDPAFDDAFVRIRDLLLMLLPRYQAQGKPYVHIAFGCTGGRHRSVFTAEQIASALRDGGFSPTLLHRNLESPALSQMEGFVR